MPLQVIITSPSVHEAPYEGLCSIGTDLLKSIKMKVELLVLSLCLALHNGKDCILLYVDLVDCLLVQNVQHISRPCVKSVVTHLCCESSRTTQYPSCRLAAKLFLDTGYSRVVLRPNFCCRRINRRKRQAQAQE